MNFREILNLPESEQAKIGNKVITPRWWDDSEIRALARQTWFNRARADLNKNGRISVNLGVLKFELGGSSEESEDMTDADAYDTAVAMLSTETPASGEDLRELQKEATAGKVFQPRFVVLEGELAFELSSQRLIELMLGYSADHLGMDLTPRKSGRALPDDELRRVAANVEKLYRALGGHDDALGRWLTNPDNLKTLRFKGQDYVRSILLSENRAEGTVVLWPRSTTELFPAGNFGARVLGWLEHAEGPQLVVRGIAAASVFFFKDAAQDVLSLPPAH